MKEKKKIIGAILLLTLILIIFLAGYTFARYYQKIDAGGGTGQIARWSFGSKNEKTTIDLSKEKIAPGSSGEFQIEVDATDSEVGVEYEILVSEEKNIPTNMKFSAKIKDQNGEVKYSTTKMSSFSELASQYLKGTIPVETGNQKRIVTVEWEWPFNENDTSNIDTLEGTLTQNSNGESNLECGFNLEIIGRQIQKN